VSVNNISPAGSNATTNLTQVGGAAIAEGQTTSANSIPVVIASDQSAIPVTIGSATVVQPTGSNLHAVLDAGTAVIGHVINDASASVIGHVIADTGSTTAVTGNVTVVQPTGSNLHVVVDTAPTTPVTIASLPNEPNLDVALSTRLKPGDTLTGVTTLGTITNPLPTGTNVLGHIITDTGSTTAVSSMPALGAGSNVIGRVLPDPSMMVQPILTYSNLILQDSNGVLWQFTLNDSAQFTRQVVTTGTVQYIFINDVVGQISYSVVPNTSGQLVQTPVTYNSAYPSVISMLTTGGLQTALFMSGGVFMARPPAVAGQYVRVLDGAITTIGSTTDAAVTGDTSGTEMAKLRGISIFLEQLNRQNVRMQFAQQSQFAAFQPQGAGFTFAPEVPAFLGGY
jgi:hypothetical protein